MRIAYFDCFSGISGDMALGALIDAGLDVDSLKSGLRSLNLEGWDLSIEQVRKGTLSAKSVNVSVQHNHCHERHLSDITDLIKKSTLPDPVKKKSLATFTLLGEAEAKIHGTQVEKIHFHEVGAVDSIVDTVGVILGLHLLHIEETYASRLPFSNGIIHAAHGHLPAPAPATLEILKGVPFYPKDLDMELITPTGAALLKTLCRGFGEPPAFTPDAIGWGAGTRDLPTQPNVLRIVIGETDDTDENPCNERLVLLETNLDDASPQLVEHTSENLFENGALDVFVTSIQMKKSRPGFMLSVLCKIEDKKTLTRILFTDTTTIGVRQHYVDRLSLPREIVTIMTPFGEVRIKIATLDGKVVNASPEYDDCKKLAMKNGVPLKHVLQCAQQAANEHQSATAKCS